MLLPSAIPCDSRNTQPISSPRRSAYTQPTFFLSSLHSPPQEPLSTATNLLHTCKRLHQILSVDRCTSTSLPSSSTNRVHKRSRAATSSDSTPKTPRRTVPPQKPATPIRKNKRRREIAFPDSSEDETEAVARDPFTTPKPKRRMATPPSPPNRNLPEKKEEEEWTAAEDKALVELVLQKLKLSWGDWEDCAKSLGRRDARSVGRRWEGLMSMSEVELRDKRK